MPQNSGEDKIMIHPIDPGYASSAESCPAGTFLGAFLVGNRMHVVRIENIDDVAIGTHGKDECPTVDLLRTVGGTDVRVSSFSMQQLAWHYFEKKTL